MAPDLSSGYGDLRRRSSSTTAGSLRLRSPLERGREGTEVLSDRHAQASSSRPVSSRAEGDGGKLCARGASGSPPLPTDSDASQSGGELEDLVPSSPAIVGLPDLSGYRRPLLADLYCGGGGCSVGYHRAGFEVVGVDWRRMPDYPFELYRGNVLDIPDEWLRCFDVIHASPPCQAFTRLRSRTMGPVLQGRLFDPHADYLTPTLEKLRALEVPWIVENVPGAPMPADSVTLCGSAFGLLVRRHRLFASSLELEGTVCDHGLTRAIGVFGHGGGTIKGQTIARGEDAARAMGIDWTTDQDVLANAIPPAYTEWIGRQVIAALELERG